MTSNPTLSQIKVGNVVYDICDTSARNEISSLNNSVTTLINKNPSNWFTTASASKSVTVTGTTTSSTGGATSNSTNKLYFYCCNRMTYTW